MGGTHISKVKGCSGTYLWGPDELARMRELGNAAAAARYGGAVVAGAPMPEASASKEMRVELCRKKYEELRWAANKDAPQLSLGAGTAADHPVPLEATCNAFAARVVPTNLKAAKVASVAAAAPRLPTPARSRTSGGSSLVMANLIDLGDAFFDRLDDTQSGKAQQVPLWRAAAPAPAVAADSAPAAAAAAPGQLAGEGSASLDSFLEQCLAHAGADAVISAGGASQPQAASGCAFGQMPHNTQESGEGALLWDNFGDW